MMGRLRYPSDIELDCINKATTKILNKIFFLEMENMKLLNFHLKQSLKQNFNYLK